VVTTDGDDEEEAAVAPPGALPRLDPGVEVSVDVSDRVEAILAALEGGRMLPPPPPGWSIGRTISFGPPPLLLLLLPMLSGDARDAAPPPFPLLPGLENMTGDADDACGLRLLPPPLAITAAELQNSPLLLSSVESNSRPLLPTWRKCNC
jgi:hypothetical protein